MQAIRAARGKTLDLSAYTPMRDGYDFGGWYADSALTQRITEIKLSGSKTVYADWKKREPDAVKNPFADVNAGDWFYRDVLFSYEKGLMSGMDAAAFGALCEHHPCADCGNFLPHGGQPCCRGRKQLYRCCA